jgi:hypothetical protein
MAYENLSKYQNTTNYSQRDIDKKFNQVEFNKIFTLLDQERIDNKNKPAENPIICFKNFKINILLVIILIIMMIGILLLLFNNFILVNPK